MPSTQDFIENLVDQIENAGMITYRKMFGEYAIYCDGKVIALVCDDMLYIKPTEGGRAFIKNVKEAPPYPGAKMYFLIDDDYDDRKWLSELVRITASEVPLPKKKPSKKRPKN